MKRHSLLSALGQPLALLLLAACSTNASSPASAGAPENVGAASSAVSSLPTSAVASVSNVQTSLGRFGTLYYTRLPSGRLAYRGDADPTWHPLAPHISSTPTVAGLPGGDVLVIARKDDGKLAAFAADGSGETSLGMPQGVPLVGVPAMAYVAQSQGPGEVRVYARGKDNALYENARPMGSAWRGWQQVNAPPMSGDPATVAGITDRIDVVYVGPDLHTGANNVFQVAVHFDGGGGPWWANGSEGVAWTLGAPPAGASADAISAVRYPNASPGAIDLEVTVVDGNGQPSGRRFHTAGWYWEDWRVPAAFAGCAAPAASDCRAYASNNAPWPVDACSAIRPAQCSAVLEKDLKASFANLPTAQQRPMFHAASDAERGADYLTDKSMLASGQFDVTKRSAVGLISSADSTYMGQHLAALASIPRTSDSSTAYYGSFIRFHFGNVATAPPVSSFGRFGVGGTVVNPLKNTVWDCTDYVDKAYWDYVAFEKDAAACGDDTLCVADAALRDLQKPLTQISGEPMRHQIDPHTGTRSKNAFFGRGALAAVTDVARNLQLQGYPDLQGDERATFGAKLDAATRILSGDGSYDVDGYYGIGATGGTPVKEAFADQWKFHSTLRGRIRGESLAELREYARRTKTALDALTQAARAQDDAAACGQVAAYTPDTPWSHDPWEIQQRAGSRVFTAAPPSTRAAVSQLTRANASSLSTVVAGLRPDFSFQNLGTDAIACQFNAHNRYLAAARTFADAVIAEYDRAQRGGGGCLDTSSYACDWLPSMLTDATTHLFVAERESEHAECMALSNNIDTNALVPVDATSSPATFYDWIQQRKQQLAGQVDEIPASTSEAVSVPGTPKARGQSIKDSARWGDPSGFSAGYEYDFGWAVAPTQVDGDGNACKLTGKAHAMFHAGATVPTILNQAVNLYDEWSSISSGTALRSAIENKLGDSVNIDGLAKDQLPHLLDAIANVVYTDHEVSVDDKEFTFDSETLLLGMSLYNDNDAKGVHRKFQTSNSWNLVKEDGKIDLPAFEGTAVIVFVPVTYALSGEVHYGFQADAKAGLVTTCQAGGAAGFAVGLNVVPEASVNVVGNVGVGIPHLQAGVRGSVMVISAKAPTVASAGVSVPLSGDSLNLDFDFRSHLELDELKGNMSVFGELGPIEGETELFSWGGFSQSPTLFNVTKSIPLIAFRKQ